MLKLHYFDLLQICCKLVIVNLSSCTFAVCFTVDSHLVAMVQQIELMEFEHKWTTLRRPTFRGEIFSKSKVWDKVLERGTLNCVHS